MQTGLYSAVAGDKQFGISAKLDIQQISQMLATYDGD